MHYCVLWLPICNFTVMMFLCKMFGVTTVECVVTICWKLDHLSHCSHLGYRTFRGHAVECAVVVGPLPWHFCCRVCCCLLKTGLFITLLAFLLQDVQGPCSRVCHGCLLKTGSFITLRIFLLQDGQGPWSILSCGCLIDTCNSMLTWGLFYLYLSLCLSSTSLSMSTRHTEDDHLCLYICDLHVFQNHLVFIILLSLAAAGTVKWWNTLYCAIMGTRYYLPHSVFTTEAGLVSWNYQIQADRTDQNGGTPYTN